MKNFAVVLLLCAFIGMATIDICSGAADIKLQQQDYMNNSLQLDPILAGYYIKIKKGVGSLINTALKSGMQQVMNVDLPMSGSCLKHLLKMLMGFKRMELWAVKMIDTTAKIPDGMIRATLYDLGDFDGCLAINASGHFRGQYCLLDFSPRIEDVRAVYHGLEGQFAPDKLIENLITNLKHMPAYISLRTAVCIPSSCAKDDIEKLVGTVVNMLQLPVKFRVPTCSVEEPARFSTIDIVAMTILAFMVFLFLLGTFMDMFLGWTRRDKSYRTNSGTFVRAMLCFSGLINSKRFSRAYRSKTAVGFNVLKFVYATVYIAIHWLFFILGSRTAVNMYNARKFFQDPTYLFFLNGAITLELFFFVSAFLMAYNLMKKEKFSVSEEISKRCLRVMPPFVFASFLAIIVPHIYSGPVWQESMNLVFTPCRWNWWANLVLWNSDISFSNTCMFWLWFIAVDVHLYILALLVLALIRRFPRSRPVVFFICLSASIAAIVGNSFYYDLTVLNCIEQVDTFSDFFFRVYSGSHLHGIPYCIGVALGCMMATKEKISVSFTASIAGWLSVLLYVFLGLYPREWLYRTYPTFSVLTAYLPASRLFLSLSAAWVVMRMGQSKKWESSIKSKGDLETSFLRILITVLGRLSYVAFIIHPFIMVTYLASSRTSFQIDLKTMIYVGFSCFVVVYCAAWVFSLLFEAPFIALRKMLYPETSAKTITSISGTKDLNGSMEEYGKSEQGKDGNAMYKL